MIFFFDGRRVEVSLRDIMADIAAAETEADLQARDGMVRATPGFLRSLAKRIRFRGFVDATAATAWQVWIAATEHHEHVRSVSVELAEVAFWYGIDPFSLTEDQRSGLMANLPRVQAQQTIHSGSYSPTDYRFIHDLFFLATGDKELARREQTRAMEAFVESATSKA